MLLPNARCLALFRCLSSLLPSQPAAAPEDWEAGGEPPVGPEGAARPCYGRFGGGAAPHCSFSFCSGALRVSRPLTLCRGHRRRPRARSVSTLGFRWGEDRVVPGSCWLRVGGSASAEAGVGGRTAGGSAALGLGRPLGCRGGEQGAAKGCPITLHPSHQETRVGLGPHGTFLGDQSSSTTYCLLVARRSCSYAGWEQWCYSPTRLWSYHGK